MNPSDHRIQFEVLGTTVTASRFGPCSAPEFVLTLPGLSSPRSELHGQFAVLGRALGDIGISTLAIDYRGMGDSHRPWPTPPLIRGRVEDACTAVAYLQDLGRRPLALIGAGFGGIVALEAARALPGAIATLVLWSVPLRPEQRIAHGSETPDGIDVHGIIVDTESYQFLAEFCTASALRRFAGQALLVSADGEFGITEMIASRPSNCRFVTIEGASPGFLFQRNAMIALEHTVEFVAARRSCDG